jgi:hypothetical protein
MDLTEKELVTLIPYWKKQNSQGWKRHFRPLKTEFGVPQGGIHSPIIFIKYGADLEECTNHSSILTYADNTSTSCHGRSQEEVMQKLEKDSKKILQLMASN